VPSLPAVRLDTERPHRLFKALKPMLPDALVFHTPEEPLDDYGLLRGVGRDELLRQPVVSTR
jgi:hypothetical protein